MKNIQIVLLSTFILLMHWGSMLAADKKVPHPSLERNKLALKVSSLLSDKAHAEMAFFCLEDKISTLLFCAVSGIFCTGLGAMGFYKTTLQQKNEHSPLAMLSTSVLLSGLFLNVYALSNVIMMLERRSKIANCDATIADYYAQTEKANKKIEQINSALEHKKNN